MLSSPQILQCLEAGLLMRGWDKSCLQSATYDMRLGAFSCWYHNGLRTVWPLGQEDDRNRDIHKILVLKPNSVTFVTTLEEFRLPCDIIARFNLKTKWVRKGLLMGTAPIVEPQFCGRLLIPVHNFSSNPVQIAYGSSMIAVEFTKTLPVTDDYVINQEPHGDIGEYLERTGIVESSVSSAFARNAALYNNIQSKTKIFSIAGAITLFLLICSVLTLLINIFNLAENARKASAQANVEIEAFARKNREELRKYDDELRELKFTIGKLKEELATKGQ